LRRLREYAKHERLDVLEEIVDDGYSGDSANRPGLHRVMELAEAGKVELVVATKRNRLFRSRFYRLLWDRDLEDLGVMLVALDDTGNRFGDAMQDEFAEWEKEEIARRTTSGKLEKARQGKVVGGIPCPNFGFRLNEARDGYVVDEETMPAVRRMFQMVGDKASSIHAVKKALEAEGIPAPRGGRIWSKNTIRYMLRQDCYRPHTFEEICAIVTPEVASKLDPHKCYGVLWYNRRRAQVRDAVIRGGERPQKKTRIMQKPREEWIGIPVADAGIPREVVDAARTILEHNTATSAASGRFWELSGGLVRCSVCGRRMDMQSRKKRNGKEGRYFYYRCAKRRSEGPDACTNHRHWRAEKLEGAVFGVVRDFLMDPERMERNLRELVERERELDGGNLDKEEWRWLGILAEADSKRAKFQHAYAEGAMTLEDLKTRTSEVDNACSLARSELTAAKARRERVRALEEDAEAVVSLYSGLVPESLEAMTSEERNQLYRMLRIDVRVHVDGTMDIGGALSVCNSDSIP
jgi:site-specific DNA recombinase